MDAGAGASFGKVPERFEQLYERERARLLVLVQALCRSSQPSVAEDIVQDAFVRAYEQWPKIAAYARPDLWLRRVAINLTVSRYRRLTIEIRRAARVGRVDDDQLALPDDTTAVWAAVRRLPRRQAQVLVLRYVDEMSTADIAETLEMATGTVRTHLRRGHDALQRDPRVITLMRELAQ